MTELNFTGHTTLATLGGITIILLDNIDSGDVLKTIVLASIGAIVSFIISLVLKNCLSKWRK